MPFGKKTNIIQKILLKNEKIVEKCVKTVKKNNAFKKTTRCKKKNAKTTTQNPVLKEITLNQKQEETQNLLAKKHRATCKNKSQSPAKKHLEKHTKLLAKKKKTQKKKLQKHTNTKHLATKKHNNHCQKKNWQKKNTKTLEQTITKSIEKNHQSKKSTTPCQKKTCRK